MNRNEEQLLKWVSDITRKAQADKAYCTLTFHMRDGQLFKAERSDSFIPPSAGALVKNTGG